MGLKDVKTNAKKEPASFHRELDDRTKNIGMSIYFTDFSRMERMYFEMKMRNEHSGPYYKKDFLRHLLDLHEKHGMK